jgi:hypothetical protein
VTFSLTPEQLAFWDPRGNGSSKRAHDFWIGASADLRANGSFELTKTHPGSAPPTALPTRVIVSDTEKIEAAKIDRWDPAMDVIVPEDWKMEKLAEGFGWAEGPVWVTSGGYLLFTDVPGNKMGPKWRPLPIHLAPPDPDVGARRAPMASAPRRQYHPARGHVARSRSRSETKQKTPVATLFEGKKPEPQRRDARSRVLFFTDPPYGFRKFDDAPEKELVQRRVSDGHGRNGHCD